MHKRRQRGEYERNNESTAHLSCWLLWPEENVLANKLIRPAPTNIKEEDLNWVQPPFYVTEEETHFGGSPIEKNIQRAHVAHR